MVPSNLTSNNLEKKNIGFNSLKKLGTPLFSRDNVVKFLNEYFFGFSEEELEAYRKSKEFKKDSGQL